MNPSKIAPYGTWESPITADLIVQSSIRLGGGVLADDDAVYWLEGRPSEGGRTVIVRRAADGATRDVNPAPFNARTRVHEYGGGSFVVHGAEVIFSNFADQRLYRVPPGETPQPLTPEAPLRYADFIVDAARGRLICVREDHSAGGEPVNTLAAVPLDGAGEQVVLVSGSDFYAAPRLSPDGTRLAWLTWQHPNMPWDGTELWLADMQPDGSLTNARVIAGAERDAITQPKWSPDGALHFVSERSGWWNLYRWRDGQAEALAPLEAEFAGPQWVFGQSNYDFTAEGDILCTYTREGLWYLARLDNATGDLTRLDTPYTSLSSVSVHGERVLFRGGAPVLPSALVLLDLNTGGHTVLQRAFTLDIDPGYLAAPEPITYPTLDGQAAHAFFYPPQNRDVAAPPDEKPPLLVISHGGPTAATSSALDLRIQYWTSRGFAVLDVNYGGSTGYGRAYRERLNGQWGIVDVEDCTHGARYLVDQGRADAARLAIRGGSAGGYTTLAALAFHDVFQAGASYYGVGDLEGLARDTHKFESRYLDGLVGPYPERRDLYQARAPLHHVERLNCPVIFFQGLEDEVVPPAQAEAMVAALREKGVPVAYVPFEGEQHGFRRAETLKRALESELYFYGRIFGFTPADDVEPVEIENLDSGEGA